MNCSDFEMNVIALARCELIDATRRELSLAHSLNCVQCAARLAGERALIAGVRVVVAELAEEKAPAHVRAALLAAFREHSPAVTGNTVIQMPGRFARHWRIERRLEAAAAAILILVSVFAVFWLYSRSPLQQQVALTEPRAPVTTTEPSRLAITDDAEVASPPATTRPSRARPRAARRNAAEEVTEFFPLIEGIDLDSLEAVQSVRVELPVSALMDLGLQPGPEMSAGPVKADVLLGPDGLARAIRFIH